MKEGSPSRLLPLDVLREGSVGLRARRLRAVLSALGIAIGIASMVAVLGISESSKASLLSALDRLGTNLLTVTPGQSYLGENSKIPGAAAATVPQLDGVESASSVAAVNGATVRRSDFVDEEETNAISVGTAEAGLVSTLGLEIASGKFLTEGTEDLPAMVLGATAAARLGLDGAGGDVLVYVSGSWFTVVGVLAPVVLAPELDSAALIGPKIARQLFGTMRSPSTIYVRTSPDRLDEIRGLIPKAANFEHPEEISVSRPSDAIAAQAAAKSAFTALFLGLGAVALLVGGVGVANVMVVSVLERRSEIGLRRALGATRSHITTQFLAEALLLSGSGGAAGAGLGALVTTGYALSRGWEAVITPTIVLAGIGAAVLIGAVAGLYPAMRAARLAPTEALRSV